MTCIIGLEYNGKVYMGGDSIAVCGWDKFCTTEEKVFIKDNMLFGVSGSYRVLQLLKHSLQIPTRSEMQTDIQYLVNEFIPAIRELFTKNGVMKVENSVEEGGYFLLGYNGLLYEIANDFQVNQSMYGMNALGCGFAYALGSLDTFCGLFATDPEEAIEWALEVSEKFSAGVTSPFVILSI